MKEKSPRRKEGKSISQLRVSYEAITVGSGRSAEPYIIAFHHKSDNVAGKNLGTLFGFFEVEVHDEDAAYIVNFLASVAKKEYFANPRRSIEDSFETTLHKVNVALAEIAKEGNVSWLGHLHGALACISDANLHFSATGNGVLGLLREDTFRPISDGLAENLSEPHPLKTFTEVSSGKLIAGDILLALSPAIWTLFTPEDIKKNARRFGEQEFEQFLRTALINELPIAGAVIVRVTTETIVVPPSKNLAASSSTDTKNTEAPLTNVWSKQAFEKAKAARLTTLEVKETLTVEHEVSLTTSLEKEEYIDRKTGHIYIQGEANLSENDPGLWKAKAELMLGSFLRNLDVYQDQFRRSFKRWKKQGVIFFENTGAFSARLGRSLSRRFRSILRHWRESRIKNTSVAPVNKRSVPQNTKEQTLSTSPKNEFFSKNFRTTLVSNVQNFEERLKKIVPSQKSIFPLSQTPSSWQLTMENHWLSLKNQLRYLYQKFIQKSRIIATQVQNFWRNRSSKERSLFLGITAAGLTIFLGSIFYMNRSTLWQKEAQQETPLNSQTTLPTEIPVNKNPEQDEPLATRLSDGRPITAPFNFTPIAFVSINNIAFGITQDRVVNTTTQESVSTPETIRLATAMDDLDALFLLGESNTLHIYTIVNKKFETNTLPLPEGIVPAALGSYLTYLYVLDEKTKGVYRFPRSEGGFAAPTKWSKQALDNILPTSLTIGESVAAIGTSTLPQLYERGKMTSVNFSGTKNPPHLTSLTFDKISGDLFALDPTAQRVVRWKTDGTLVAQYFHPSFEVASHIIVGEKNILLVIRPDGTFVFQLP